MRSKTQVVLHLLVVTAMLLAAIGIVPASASFSSIKSNRSTLNAPGPDEVVLPPTAKMIEEQDGANKDGKGEGKREGDPAERDASFYSRRTAGDPSVHFTMADAAALRAIAADQTAALRAQLANKPVVPNAYSGAWTGVGPNPMVLTSRGDATFDAMAGRIGALAVASTAPYTIYLGGAQGGIWESSWVTTTTTNQWTPKTDQLSSLAIGAIALAPSNESIVYVGTGEGALSGDSYFGNGVLKSTDAGNTFSKISAAGYFTGVSISKIVVDNTDPNTLYAGTLRGRGGALRTSPPNASSFGVWKSVDGGVNWTEVLTATTNPLDFAGVTDMVMDPQNSQVIYASMLGRGISKTVDSGVTWTSAMNGLPATGNYATAPTRFSLGLSRPSAVVSATLYTGFEYYSGSTRIASSVWKSTNDGLNWNPTSTAVIGDYCGGQCWYDNVIGVDPISPTVVYALGLYNYGTGSGGIYRSMDGGANWTDLGFNLHPDYHAIAIRKDDPTNIVMGNDGGAWLSASRGGRPGGSTDPITATTWVNLNGKVNPVSSTTLVRTGLQIGQATSVATNPAIANRFYEGTQDNGTQRKTTGSSTWTDVASGDGGFVLIDPTDANYLYGTYYGLSPYRFTDGGGLYGGGYTSNEYIVNGLYNDRTDFYTPWIMNPGNSEQLYIGTYRVYRTDNAKAVKSSDVLWNPISSDLTSGCLGAAANGGRGCYVSALASPAESSALYVGTMEGWLWLSTDAATADAPTWARIDISGTTPLRPVSAIAVDRSNYRVAYAAFSGFSQATPATPGHVFKTTDGGTSWTRIDLGGSGFPDVPVNNFLLDPSAPNTLYAGTDVGPYVTYDGGATWTLLGTGFPIVSIEGMALNPYTRQLVAATHGRGVWKLDDQSTLLPALEIGKTDDGRPAGPGSFLTYQITVKNYGNITATNVVITDPIPANTMFVTAGPGGTFDGTNAVFTLTEVAKPSSYTTPPSSPPTGLNIGLLPGEKTVTFTVQITTALNSGDVITNDGYLLTSAEGVSAVGSPHYKTLAPAYAFAMSPDYQWDGTNPGQVITYLVSIENLGYNTDSYNLVAVGNAIGFNTTLWNETFTAFKSTTDPVAPGDTAIVGVKVVINPSVANGVANTDLIIATSVASPSESDSVQIKTIAVTDKILMVDDDGGGPDVQSYYEAALDAYGLPYNTADLTDDPLLPTRYMKAHKAIVMFAGATYPGNLGSYETGLAAFLDGGGRLFLSGWDLLDQSAGTTDFVYDYLHVNWDGSETQNDVGTGSATAVISNSITTGLGVLPYDYASIGLGGADYSDQLTLVSPADSAFTDTGTGETDGLTVQDGAYKVMFLAFPYEAIESTARRTDLMTRALDWFLGVSRAASSVTITGPSSGIVNTNYSYVATVTPVTTTQPITYTWQATDQSNVVHVGNITDTVTYNWAVAGTKTITVTADNGHGTQTSTKQVAIGVPPASVTINGPSSGNVNTNNSYVAQVTPVTTTQPITYTWQATGQSDVVHAGGGISDTATFNWSTAGTKTITVTADNGYGSVMNTTQVVISVPPTGVTISGPASGVTNASYNYVAPVTPASTTQPITYTWQATGQSTMVHTGGGISDTATFNWSTAGTKTITVTANNGYGSAMNTKQVIVALAGIPPTSVTISGAANGFVNHSYDFTAPVSPISTTQPITYTWQATGQSTVVHTGGGASDMVSFSWPVTGTKTVTVTANNGFSSVMDTAQITIGWYQRYLPLVLKQ